MSSKEIFALRKAGRAAEALTMARTEFPKHPDDIWLLRGYAWALYDHVKKVLDAFEQGRLSPSALSSDMTPYMQEFSMMADPLRGDAAFSQILRLAKDAAGGWGDFLSFARWAGIDDFDDKGKAPFVTNEGKTVDSLQMQFKRAICRKAALLAGSPQPDRELLEWGRAVLEAALKDAPDDQWLNYYQSKVHLACGEVSLATKRLAPALRRQSRAAWPWALLGQILERTQPDDAVTCYAHATQIARDEQEIAKTRICLGQLLARAGRFNEAAHQVVKALRYREEQRYRLPPELESLVNSDWYRRAVADYSQQAMPDVSSAARNLLRSLDQRPISYKTGVVEHINADKALSYVALSATEGIPLYHRTFPEVVSHPPGTLLEIGQADASGPAQDWRVAKVKSLPGFYELRLGQMTRQDGHAFAFIRTEPENVFVPPALANDFLPGQPIDITCWAIRRADRSGKIGWRAVRIVDRRALSIPDQQ